MSLKAINESYRAFSDKFVAHIKKYMRQMVATVLAGVASFRGSGTYWG